MMNKQHVKEIANNKTINDIDEKTNIFYMVNDWAHDIDSIDFYDSYDEAINGFIGGIDALVTEVNDRCIFLYRYEGNIPKNKIVQAFEKNSLENLDDDLEKAIDEMLENNIVYLSFEDLEKEKNCNISIMAEEFFNIRGNLGANTFLQSYCLEIIDKLIKTFEPTNQDWITDSFKKILAEELQNKINSNFSEDNVNSYCKIWLDIREKIKNEYETWQEKLENLAREKESRERKESFIRNHNTSNLWNAIKKSLLIFGKVNTWGEPGVYIGNPSCLACFNDDQYEDGEWCKVGYVKKNDDEVLAYMDYDGAICLTEGCGIYERINNNSFKLKYSLKPGTYNVYRYRGIIALKKWKKSN